MTIFQNLEQTVQDYRLCFLEVNTARREAQGIISSIESRAKAEQAQRAERVSELKKQLADNSRSSTVRRLAESELAELEAQHFEPSVTELEAFECCCVDLAQAAKDAEEGRKRLKDLFTAAKAEMDELRAKTLGNHGFDPVLLARAAADLREQFSGMLARIGQ